VPGLALCRVSVTPGITPVTVFDALEMLIPFTVREALLPACACVKPKLPPDDDTVKAPALPVVLLTIAS